MTLTAMLLAGGCSRRMGRDKATLVFDGEPLWQRQLRALRKLPPTVLWVSGRTRPVWCPPELEIVLDEPPSRGPLSGLGAGLSRLQTSHLLVLAIDLPRVPVVHLRKLWSLAEPGKAVIPLNEDYFEPLCAVYPAEASPIAQQALSSGDFSLQHLAKSLVSTSLGRAYAVPPQERPFYLNLNTPADLPAKKLYGHDVNRKT
ncbi:MAG TPA: molybdenum cofactor guanylyltransferase [Candidatus Acidoferrum sp.]|jgi:molybdopterin-guanine dinucleotide biosynthesis protein A|nr:molybdenum cofactor guanylyltransferase [Candidatus Acidoferrum sp.]